MIVQSPRTRAGHRHPYQVGKRSCSCGKRKDPDHRAAVHALHSAVAARALNLNSRRREHRVYECDLCAGWHLSSSHLADERPLSSTTPALRHQGRG